MESLKYQILHKNPNLFAENPVFQSKLESAENNNRSQAEMVGIH